MSEHKIMIATGNPGKMREITKILEAASIKLQVHSIAELNIPEPDEPYESFIENAKHKAKYYAEHANMPTLSEDSGLCIKALNGFPGVRSKEFVAECADLPQAFAKLEALLAPHTDKTATFVCAAAIYFPQKSEFITYIGEDHGSITFPPRGSDCFGFDPIYIPEGYTKTMAQLGIEIKSKIGHRAKALDGLLQLLKESHSYIE